MESSDIDESVFDFFDDDAPKRQEKVIDKHVKCDPRPEADFLHNDTSNTLTVSELSEYVLVDNGDTKLLENQSSERTTDGNITSDYDCYYEDDFEEMSSANPAVATNGDSSCETSDRQTADIGLKTTSTNYSISTIQYESSEPNSVNFGNKNVVNSDIQYDSASTIQYDSSDTQNINSDITSIGSNLIGNHESDSENNTEMQMAKRADEMSPGHHIIKNSKGSKKSTVERYPVTLGGDRRQCHTEDVHTGEVSKIGGQRKGARKLEDYTLVKRSAKGLPRGHDDTGSRKSSRISGWNRCTPKESPERKVKTDNCRSKNMNRNTFSLPYIDKSRRPQLTKTRSRSYRDTKLSPVKHQRTHASMLTRDNRPNQVPRRQPTRKPPIPIPLKSEAMYCNGELTVNVCGDKRGNPDQNKFNVTITVLHKYARKHNLNPYRAQRLVPPRRTWHPEDLDRDIVKHRATFPGFNTATDPEVNKRYLQQFGL